MARPRDRLESTRFTLPEATPSVRGGRSGPVIRDPLRKEVTGSFGVYVVPRLVERPGVRRAPEVPLGGLEQKLVQSRVFNHYLGRPTSWGVDSLSPGGSAAR